jgi:hypothetical protein
MMSTELRAFWRLTINTTKEAVRLYFEPLRRIGRLLLYPMPREGWKDRKRASG